MNSFICNKEDFVSIADALRNFSEKENKLSFPYDFMNIVKNDKKDLENKNSISIYNSKRVEKIIPCAFFNCAKLQEVNLPILKEVGYQGFLQCSSLKIINLPLVEKIGSDSFAGDYNLEKAFLPNVQTVASYSFSECSRLKEVDIEQATIIDPYAFYYCSSLVDLNIKKVKQIGRNAFYQCTSLEKLQSDTIEQVNDYAFYNCSSLKFVDLPNCVSLGDANKNFYNCTSLESVNLPKAKNLGTVDVGSTHGTFLGCIRLKNINAPLAEKIGQSILRDCLSLESIDLPSLNTGISSYSFINCQNLETFNAPKANGYRYQTFMDCYSLRNLNFPSDTSYVSTHSFKRCYNLRSLTLNSRVPVVANEFIYARNLCNLVLNDTETLVALENTNAFNETAFQKGEGTIFVPDKFIEDYKVATNWSVFANQFKPMSQYIPCTGLSLNVTELSLIGKTPYTLTVTTIPSVTTDPLSWKSKDQTVAIVENGVIKPKSNGTTVITAYCGNQLIRCTVNITGIDEPSYENTLYKLPKGQVFQRWNTLEYPETYINTSISVADQDIDSTIMGEITCAPHNNNWGTIFDCQQDANPSVGFKLVVLSQNNDDNLHLYAYGKSVKMDISCWKDAPNVKFVLTHRANTNEVVFKYLFNNVVTEISITGSVDFQAYSNPLTLAARRKENGTYDRNWYGTCHDFIVLNRIATDEEITAYLV